MKTVRDLLFDNPRIDPNRPALASGATRMSFADLREAAAGVARALCADGVSKGDRVCVLVENVPEYIVSYFGILAIGAVYVPLNWRLHSTEHVLLMRNSEPKVLIASSAFRESISAASAGVPSLRRIVTVGETMAGETAFARWTSLPGDLPDDSIPTPESPAAIVYTSGTTSLPKGVLLTHDNIVVDLQNVSKYARPDHDCINVHVAPLYHQTLVHNIVHLAYGASILLIKKFDPREMMAQIEQARGTYIFLAPTMLYEMLDHPEISRFDLSSLRTVVYGAAPITGPRLRQAIEVLGTKLIQGYGLTEATSNVSYLDKEEHLIAEGSIGRGIPGVECRVVNDSGSDCKPGEVGEIIVRGPTVMKGYWREEEATAKTIIDGWLHSGDLARVDERGYMYIVDRKKDLVISGGVNIYPRDIEDVLSAHPDIAEAAAFGIPDGYWGEILVGAVIPRPGTSLDAAKLQAFCRTRLGGYQVPKKIEILSELPKNPSGKVLKRELRRMFAPPSVTT